MIHKETQNFTRVNVSTRWYAEVKATWHEVKEQKEGRGKRKGIGTFHKFRECLENLESLCVPLKTLRTSIYSTIFSALVLVLIQLPFKPVDF